MDYAERVLEYFKEEYPDKMPEKRLDDFEMGEAYGKVQLLREIEEYIEGSKDYGESL